MGQSVYLVIDIQRDYFPGGAMALYRPAEAAEAAKKGLETARAAGMPVIIVQHIALAENATFFRPNTPGAALMPDFEPREDDRHLVKHYANAFRETRLDTLLQQLNVEEIVMSGMMTHMCIDTTCRAAADRGYRVTLLEDATATRDLTFRGHTVPADAVQTAYLAALASSFARVVSTDFWIEHVKR
ncbi:cysteine hydrolase family protein [Sulfobacillus harzensis]|uniref:Cysteine hydrolase n=1 Tax=Sulfobacillus harzensis TaxID=2729629 RepID=A0A7Y0L4R3_9FIRM|nr:cysteine hydrolase family protein [Sulfobacillus harzensis]NMP23288.1 cysteine hydrolase [Sulfobacillus harzensis]